MERKDKCVENAREIRQRGRAKRQTLGGATELHECMIPHPREDG